MKIILLTIDQRIILLPSLTDIYFIITSHKYKILHISLKKKNYHCGSSFFYTNIKLKTIT